ncbi:DEAD/DEAH box helicase [Caldalkalibacillus mannanilyticus]|uniref:DEAD/DEAH box helicase n=1 Tax=Caldalkalibacillus mannanilyticus TaxID=1418 RepID=UPI000468507E|nr:DEAD/DEAH box helicase [Caldalkalibacillus mannanilyticus]
MRFRDLYLNTERIKQLSSSDTVYKRGKSYWMNGHVTKLRSETNHLWKAKVIGSEIYNVSIDFDTHEQINAYCECPAHYSYDGFCKHIVAVLFRMKEKWEEEAGFLSEYKELVTPSQKTKSILTKNTIHTQQMIKLFDKYRENNKNPTRREDLKVEFICNIVPVFRSPSLFSVEMRIGTKRLYVVRQIRELLKSVSRKQHSFFTANFSYEPFEQQFTEEDQAVIDILITIMNNEAFYKESSSGYAFSQHDERALRIPPFLADSFFTHISKCHVIFYGSKPEETLLFKEELPSFSFQLHEWDKEEGFLLKMKDLEEANFLEAYNYILIENTLYKVPEETFQLLFDLKKTIPQAELRIEKKDIEGVISHVIPSLKTIGRVEIADNISDQIINPPLKTMLKIDLKEQRLLVQLEFHYADVIITPLHQQSIGKEQSGSILLRDVEKEQEIMDLIESTSLKWNGQEMYIEKEEDIYSFLFISLPELEKHAEILLTSTADSMIFKDQHPLKTKLDISSSTNLLEVSFEMDGIEHDEIIQILRSVIEKKKYYRLSDGRFVSLEDDHFTSAQQLFEELGIHKNEIQKQTIQAPSLRALQLDEIIKEGSVKIGKGFRNLLNHIKHPEDLEFKIPHHIDSILRDYQKFGFQWLKTLSFYHFGGILADDMGLGKTLQAITFILSESEEQVDAKRKTLIVSPASLVYNWKREFERFAPDLKVQVMSGDLNERMTTMQSSLDLDVLITSYPLLRRDIELYEDQHFHTFILDEAQAIKNDQTQQSQAVRKIRAKNRFALSGTPIENSLDELWSIFQVILPGLFPSKQGFKQLEHKKISKLVSPFILRRMKRDVLTELPDKIESIQVSELTKEQKELYIGYLDKIKRETRESLLQGQFQKNRMKILAGLTRLRQLCCHPALFLENYNHSSGKLEQLLELVDESLSNNRRILIFSQFTSMLEIIRQEIEHRSIDYYYLDGKTEKQERVNMTEKFNKGERSIFLISLKAGGTGLNLIGADTVILYDLWWNPAVDEQAVDRAHRMGQKNVVQVIRLITHGTIEEKIFELQQKKKELINQIIQPGEAIISSLSEEDIRDLLEL